MNKSATDMSCVTNKNNPQTRLINTCAVFWVNGLVKMATLFR